MSNSGIAVPTTTEIDDREQLATVLEAVIETAQNIVVHERDQQGGHDLGGEADLSPLFDLEGDDSHTLAELAGILSSLEPEGRWRHDDWEPGDPCPECGTNRISVIEHAEASLSHRGASRLGDVSTTEDFAQEHARDLLEQEIVSALEQVLEGETVAGVRKATSDDLDSPFVVTANSDEQEIGRQHVRISPQTAVRAREELRSHIEYSDSEMDTSDAEEAIEDLEQSLRADTPRTRVVREKNMEEIVVRGVPRGAIKIDYGPVPPRAVIHTPDNCVVEPVISLPVENEADQTDAGAAASNRGGE